MTKQMPRGYAPATNTFYFDLWINQSFFDFNGEIVLHTY